MKDDLISIIVPVFNVEKHLDRCVNSIVSQTYKNLEIILVDDGSPDSCPQLCDNWRRKDSRIVVIHKKNEGLSSARNAGIEKSKGKYIGFVDSDDYIAVDMYEKLYYAIVENSADMVICSYLFLNESGNRVEGSAESPIRNEVLNRQQILQKLDMTKPNYWYYVTAWNKLYKRNILEKVNFREGKIHEDEFAIHNFFDICTKVVTINCPLYYYIQHENSIMTAKFTPKRLNIIEALEERYNFFEERGYKNLAYGTLVAMYRTLICIIKDKDTRYYKREIGVYVKRIMIKLMCKGNLRAVKLGIIYIVYCLKFI